VCLPLASPSSSETINQQLPSKRAINVAELSQLLRVRDRGGARCRNARALLAEKLGQVEERLKELQSLREALTKTLAEWDARLATTSPGVLTRQDGPSFRAHTDRRADHRERRRSERWQEPHGTIVGHFRHIASAFKKGDYEMPMFIHGQVPPGAPQMKQHAAEIDYQVDALAAIHEFLRFQIDEHHTGDNTEVHP
jgi:DNA-binding transcriptional MerR regulator